MIRSEQPLTLHLARHAEAFKNLEKRHGGGDQRLTPRGVEQAKNIGEYLIHVAGIEMGKANVIHQPEGRSEETARRANEIIKGRISQSDDLVGIDLGVRTGLSESELEEQFPEVAASILKWRTTRVGFEVPEVPGGESMGSFSSRILRGIARGVEACRDDESLVIVGTTSTLVMMNHMLEYDGKYHALGYAFVDAPLGSISSWAISDEPPVQISNLIVPGEVLND